MIKSNTFGATKVAARSNSSKPTSQQMIPIPPVMVRLLSDHDHPPNSVYYLGFVINRRLGIIG